MAIFINKTGQPRRGRQDACGTEPDGKVGQSVSVAETGQGSADEFKKMKF